MEQEGLPQVSSADGQNKDKEILVRCETLMFSGPLPPPEVFARYDQILPGSADRILKMAEKQSEHRQAIERQIITGEQFRANVGLFFGFFLGLVIIVGGVLMICLGKNWQGFTALIFSVVALTGCYIIGKKQKDEDLEQKDEDLQNRINELEEKNNTNEKVIDGETVK